MSDSLPLLVETADRLFGDLAANPGAPLDAVWTQLADAGFPLLLTSEDEGGFGGDWADAFAVLRLAGFHALQAPLADAVVAGWAAGRAGLAPAEGLSLVAQGVAGELAEGRFSGRLSGVATEGGAHSVIAWIGDVCVRLQSTDAARIEVAANPAGEPRATLAFAGARAEVGRGAVDVLAAGALARTAQIAGALDAALTLSIGHANERTQFGRPIGKFQALQQNLAVFAEVAAAVNCAAQAAAGAMDRGEADLEIAAAKLRANMAAGVGAAAAHQAHGAIGFTREHPLHRLTTRLTSWRSEFGGDRFWSERLGRRVAALGADRL